ncbi:type I restriction enzyme, S subunit [Desulfonatronum zhilinae]|nr:type I restriction enzyme, S subunit [Desulfonatronum zhilinae]
MYGTNGQCGWHNEALDDGPSVILGRKGMGNLGVEWCSGPFWVIDTAYFVIPKTDALDLRFFYYLIGYIGLNHLKDGTSNPSLSRDTFAAQLLPFPPMEIQQTIAETLAYIDDKIEQNRRTARVLERLTRAIFRAWFVDFEPVKAKAAGATAFPSMPQPVFDALPTRFVDSEIGPVPEGWVVKAVSEAFDVNPTRSLRKSERAPYLDMKNMPTNGHAPDSWIERPFGSGMRFMNGDTLVARITPCLENGKTSFVDFLEDGQIAWGSTEYIVLRPLPPLPPLFAYCLARTDEFRDFAIQNMTGTSGRQRVASTAMDHFRLAVPSEEVAVEFGEIMNPMFDCIRGGMEESRKLAEMRDYLLPKLLSGLIRVEAAP